MVVPWLDFEFLCFLSSHPLLTLLTFYYPPPSLPPPLLHTLTTWTYSLCVVKQEIYLSIYPSPSPSPSSCTSITVESLNRFQELKVKESNISNDPLGLPSPPVGRVLHATWSAEGRALPPPQRPCAARALATRGIRGPSQHPP